MANPHPSPRVHPMCLFYRRRRAYALYGSTFIVNVKGAFSTSNQDLCLLDQLFRGGEGGEWVFQIW